MRKTLSLTAVIFAAGLLISGCSTATTNSNANTEGAVAATRPGPDNSDITTSTDANGVRTETRVFKDNQHISKIVVTTRNGTRTTRVYSRNGEEKEIQTTDSQNVLEETGDAIADAAGFVAAKTVSGTEKAVEVGKTAAEKTKDTAKTVGDKTVEGAKTAGEKTAEGAKTVADKTSEGAKKAGKAIKRAVKP